MQSASKGLFKLHLFQSHSHLACVISQIPVALAPPVVIHMLRNEHQYIPSLPEPFSSGLSKGFPAFCISLELSDVFDGYISLWDNCYSNSTLLVIICQL